MRNLIIILTILMVFSGCGSSGDKSASTNPVGVTQPWPGTTPPGGSTVTPTTPGVTPYGHGTNANFPRGDIYLEFNKSSNGQVFAEGDLDLAMQFGSLDCVLPVGAYELLTATPGQEKTTVHNYGGITLTATGPVSFTALLENSLSMQNQNGEWVMHAVLKLTSVNGTGACAYPMTLAFYMPLAN